MFKRCKGTITTAQTLYNIIDAEMPVLRSKLSPVGAWFIIHIHLGNEPSGGWNIIIQLFIFSWKKKTQKNNTGQNTPTCNTAMCYETIWKKSFLLPFKWATLLSDSANVTALGEHGIF